MIHISMDLDWAPDWAIEEAVGIVLERGLSLTVFVTHDSPVVRALADEPRVERALHPNYMPGSSHGSTTGDVLDFVQRLVPEGRGVRSHGLWRGTSFVVEYARRGLAYEASDLLFLQPGLSGGRYWNGVAQLPIWWEDDVQMMHGRPMTLDDLPLADLPPFAAFDFHPILLALNSATLDGYGALKRTLGERGVSLIEASREDVARHADAGDGDRRLLEDLCDWCAERERHGRRTLAEAAEALP